MNAAVTIAEAETLARRIVEAERGKCGGSVPLAISRASSLYGVEEHTLRSLWERRARKFVKAHVFLRLQQIEAYIRDRSERERRELAETASTLERTGHPLAGVARRAAEMAGANED